MDIDQRLEALTHTLELLASMQVETEKQMARFANETERRMIRLAETMAEMAMNSGRLEKEMVARTGRLDASMAKLADGMALLTRITPDHSERIEKLEGGQAH